MAAGLYLVQFGVYIVIGAVILLYVANCLLNQKVWIRKTNSWGTKEEYPKIFKMNIIGGTLIGLYLVITPLNLVFVGAAFYFLAWLIIAAIALYAASGLISFGLQKNVANAANWPVGMNPSLMPEPGQTMQSVVNVLDQQKTNAEKDAQRLRRQLDDQSATASQMATMQVELANLQQMVVDSEHVKQQMEQEMEELRKSGGDASLQMQDSVIGGDSMVGSTKIEKQQIINNPEAIARAAVEAYRMAKNEDSN